MPSRPAPLPAAQRTARPRSRSRAAKAAAKAAKPSRSKRRSAAARAGTRRSSSACRLAAAAGSISASQATPVDAAATRCSRRLMPMPITATRPAPRATVSISTPPSLRPGSALPTSQRSLGHFRPMRSAAPGRGSSASARADADREREAREVDAGGERPGQREGERRARRRLPRFARGGLGRRSAARRRGRAARARSSAGASRAQASRSALVEAVSATRSISTAAGPPVFTSPSVRAWCRGTCGCRSGRRTASSPSSSAGPRAPGRSRSSAPRPARCRAAP